MKEETNNYESRQLSRCSISILAGRTGDSGPPSDTLGECAKSVGEDRPAGIYTVMKCQSVCEFEVWPIHREHRQLYIFGHDLGLRLSVLEATEILLLRL